MVIATPYSNDTRGNSTHGPHQTVKIKIRLIIVFGEADYSQQKQDQERSVAQTISTLLQNSSLS